MAEDKTVRLILGVLLVLISLPFLTMGTMMGGLGSFGGYGMMGLYTGFFWPGMIFMWAIGIGLFCLGLYLILDSLKK